MLATHYPTSYWVMVYLKEVSVLKSVISKWENESVGAWESEGISGPNGFKKI